MPANAATDIDASDIESGADLGITVGVTGQPWRASVSTWGSVAPWGEAVDRPLDWAIAADDRWHRPRDEAAVRQRRIDGTPVVETRVRIPDGDVIQRIWSVADRGGLTIVEIENDSPLPFAVAFFGRPVLTERTPTDIPIQGIDLPDAAITLPVAHHTSIRVAIPHGPLPAGLGWHGVSLASLAAADAVVSGWSKLTTRATRLNLPDARLAESVIEARCDLLLVGPVDPKIDPVGFVLDVGELVRCGDDADAWLPEIVVPLESAARGDDPQLLAALEAAQRIALAAGDTRAARDIAKLHRRVAPGATTLPLSPFNEVRRGRSAGRFVAAIERRLADGGNLLPMGLPASWLGVNFEMHGIPTGVASSVSLAVRWHGDRPAILWEQDGPPRHLTATAVDSDWSTSVAAGEGLWVAPRSARATSLPLTVATTAQTPVASASVDRAAAAPVSDPAVSDPVVSAQPTPESRSPAADPDSTSFS